MSLRLPRPILGAVAVVVLLAGAGAVRAAEAPVTIENVRVGFDGTYKVGCWIPVWVDLKAGPARFAGILEVTVPDDDQTPTAVRVPVALDARQFATFVAYVRPGGRNSEFRVLVRDEFGNPKTNAVDAEEKNGKPFTDLEPGQTIVLSLGNPIGVGDVGALAGFSSPNANPSTSELFVIKPPSTAALPARWYGYDGVQVVVLDTNDAAVMGALDSRGRVLADWVRDGGHLVIAGTANWQRLREGPLKDLLPAVPSGTTRLNDLGALETFAGSTNNPIPGAMTALVLEGADARGGRALAQTTSTPIVVRGPYGFGRVTLVGLDVDQKPFSDWKDRALFWVKALDLHGRGEAVAPGTTAVPGALVTNNVTDASTLMYRALQDFPGVTLVPFGWVAFFVFIYILLIGPGDYFFLKKVVKRMELTWVTFPAIVIVVSAVAYFAAYAMKGTELRVNKVDLVDVDQTSNLVRGESWATVFSPQNRDYDIGFVPLPLDRETKLADAAKAKGETAKPPAGVERLVGAFGSHDAIFGGSSPGRLSLTGSGYSYAPMGEAERLEGVRIAIWSTKSVVGRWVGPAGSALLETDLAPVSGDRLAGSITNRGNRPLKNVSLVFGKQIYDGLGTIAPGATIRVDPVATRNRPLSGYLSEAAGRLAPFSGAYGMPYSNNNQQQHIPRADVLRLMMFREALGGPGAATPSVSFRRLDLSGQIALDRPVLIAELDGPACELDLKGAPVEPKTEQTTLLRVVLPLSAPADVPAVKAAAVAK